jgi:FkbM family methyltransferase
LITRYLAKIPFLRRRIAHEIKYSHFSSLNISIPVKNGFSAPIPQFDAYDSFSEIFILNEYDDIIPDIEFNRIIDIGANYGYFTIWLQSMHPKQSLHALLIEPSRKCIPSLTELTKDPSLSSDIKVTNCCIGNPSKSYLDFFERPFMASSAFRNSTSETTYKVKIIEENEIIDNTPPPYDLIKCDIEGSEWELLCHYPKVISKCRYLLIEWHSWHSGGGGICQIEDKLHNLNFEIKSRSGEQLATGRDGKVGMILAKNLHF